MIKRLAILEPTPPWSFLSAVGAVLALIAALLIGVTLAQFILSDSISALITGWSMGMILIAFYVMVARRRTPKEALALRLETNNTNLPILVLLSLGLAITIDLLSQVMTGNFNLSTAELSNFTTTADPGDWLVAGLFLLLLQPVGEGLIFHGIVFPSARALMGAWAGLLLSAGFYAVFHLLAYPPPPDNQTVLFWYGSVQPFLIGMTLSCVRAYTGSTRATIIAHIAFNLFALLKLL